MIREPLRNPNIFGSNGQDSLLGSILTWENSDKIGDDSVSVVDTI